jgi:hypothetical protein
MQEPNPEPLEAARTAAAVLCLLEGADAPMQELLEGLATREQLDDIARQLRSGDRNRRARMLASYLGRLAVQLDTWSLR